MVSAEVSDELEIQRHQDNRPPGVVTDAGNLKVWVVTWAELIQRAKEELHLARAHLEQKSRELATEDFLREKFPQIQKELDGSHPARSPAEADSLNPT